MFKEKRHLLIIVAAIAVALFTPALAAQDDPTLVVRGHAESRMEPDQATVELGVTRRNQDAKSAQQAVNQVVQEIVAAISDLGVSKERVQTSQLTLHPVYDHRPGRENVDLEILGYDATYTVTIDIQNLEQIGPAIDAALDAGANRLQGVRFGLQDDTSARESALSQAVQQAVAKARTLAEAAGVRLVRIVEVSEGSVGVQPLYSMRMAQAEAADSATSVLPGQVTVSANVTVRYEIADDD